MIAHGPYDFIKCLFKNIKYFPQLGRLNFVLGFFALYEIFKFFNSIVFWVAAKFRPSNSLKHFVWQLDIQIYNYLKYYLMQPK